MNGYFKLIDKKEKAGLRLIPPTEGGVPVQLNDVMEYMTMKDYACDLPSLRRAVKAAEEAETVFLFDQGCRYAERECFKLTVTPDKMQAYAKFYAASETGSDMTEEEIRGDLAAQGIRSGIKDDVISRFVQNREYCEDILIAEGTAPIQGKDAYIEYKFNTDKKAKPTLKEDGSVDFFNLNILCQCNKGDLLAVLHPEEPGTDGENIYGERVKPADVKTAALKFGNNIELSEDGLTLTSLVDGHVELVEGQVFVSDVLTVENVDNSTGNIECEGSVQVNGNVFTNFSVKAKGDVIVKGVVEGAAIHADGNIVITRGMNGMGRGTLYAGGNIVAKFLENVTAQADGYVASESILHSRIMAGGEVNVDGKRGFITGGRVCAAGGINVKTLGSEMGADTTVEVGTDPKVKGRIAQLQKQIEEDTKTLESIKPVLASTMQKLKQGAKFNPDQVKYIQSLTLVSQQKTAALKESQTELEELAAQAGGATQAQVRVKGMVYPGTKVCIDDVSMTVQKTAHYCRFIKERGDVKITPY